MLFQKVSFRTELFDSRDNISELVETCSKLKGFYYDDYFGTQPYPRARLIPLWSDNNWRSPEFESFWKARETPIFQGITPTFEGIFQGDGGAVADFEKRLVELEARDTYYSFTIANRPDDCHDSSYNHYLSIGVYLSIPLALSLEFNCGEAQSTKEEKSLIWEAAKEIIPRFSEIEFGEKKGIRFCSNPSKVKNRGAAGKEKHLDGITIKEGKRGVNVIRFEYDLQERDVAFQQFCKLKSAVQDRFNDKLLSADIMPPSMPQFLAMNDISYFGEGEFILPGHLKQGLDFLAPEVFAENSVIPIGRLVFDSGDVTNANLQLIRSDGNQYFIEFIPLWLGRREQVDRTRDTIEKALGGKLIEWEGDFRDRWSDLVKR